MARRKKREDGVDTSGGRALTHNPFAALRGAQSPPAPESPDRDPEPEPAPPDPLAASSKVVVRRERAGRGGKTVTRISGLPAEGVEDLGRRMKKALGCGATVEQGDLLLLGNVVDRAADWLEREGARRVVRGN